MNILKDLYKIFSRNLLEYGKTRQWDSENPTHFLNYVTISFILRIRDIMDPPENLLDNINIKSDSIILDYGCGPGNFSVAVSKLFAGTCKIFALDMHPLAINDISKKIKKHKITNIETILSDCDTGLDSNSVDVILLHYVFNDLTNTNDVLQELHRILKPTGILSFLEFNIEEISPKLSKSELFELKERSGKVHIFVKK